MSILDEIKQSFKSGTTLIKLIYINVAVFVAVRIAYLIFYPLNSPVSSEDSFISWLAVPSNSDILLQRPWTILTYMFLHEDFMHILFNMLWLWWFGRIFLQFLDQKKLLGIYFLGGISGAIFYILAFNIFPAFAYFVNFSICMGASASIIAIVVAISFYIPDHKINLMFIGPVKLKYIALVSIGLDILSIKSENSGGHIAHLGGALYGLLYIMSFKKGKDFTKGLNNFLMSVFTWKNKSKKNQMHVSYKKPKTDMDYNAEKAKNQEEINKVLDKIAKSGYDSLTKQEKEILFKESNKN
ncbi:MAG: rhomboid family intramembrane serine protease [Bacteroidota bacterium]